MTFETILLYLAGIAHFGILIASATAPKALNWKVHLDKLPLLLRQMFWVYGVFIVIMIICFGIITLIFAPKLAEGNNTIGKAVCILIAIFWGTRLAVQFFVFDAKPWLTNWIYKTGYHLLTLIFIFITAVYTWAAFT